SLRWTCKGQIEHYKTILEVANLSNSKVLDFGCGKGDLYQYFKEVGINVDYTGIDINERLINLARLKHPDARFLCMDILEKDIDETFDHILICGVFNLKFQGIEDTIKTILTRLFSKCRHSLAFNALSAHNPKKDFELNYIYPEDIFSFAIKELSPFVSLRHDRLNYDFNIFIYKNRNGFDE
ncbi:MAG: class I SAM-dependent methyltransferase, partial [Thermodesulfovibrionales bacterium]|nr:class I SAM-dependent methyltransferase [Thermodesulfovibrionales bacterium]